MASTDPDLSTGHEAFERRAWREAHAALSSASERGRLDAAGLWRLALASYLIGREGDFVTALRDAHGRHMEAGRVPEAARAAFWIGYHYADRGDVAQATGWFGRAARLLEEAPADCAERGYMRLPDAFRRFVAGDNRGAADAAEEAAAIGQRLGDADLLALALHVQGRALIRMTQVERGLALLDEAMVAVATDELAPHVTGLIYCSVIGACREVLALRRVREWTHALAQWCEGQPDMVPYAGECRIYRAELLQLQGDWDGAMVENRNAAEKLAAAADDRAAATAHYQRAELHRLRGEYAAAEEAYQAAARSGRQVYPGLALLRLAQGERSAALAASRRVVAETEDGLRRARLLPAHIEILLECGAVDEARGACAELGDIAGACGGGLYGTAAAQGRGAIALAAGDAVAALGSLRAAWREWRALDAPYEAARVRVLIGRACRALGDEDGARLEFAAARAVFERLGAAPDLTRLDALTRRRVPPGRHGLTPREREVLALVATGLSNRAVGDELSISEKTVARHLANIFTKLGVSSRSAATAYAWEHHLLDSPA